jgi:hypothetical protein
MRSLDSPLYRIGFIHVRGLKLINCELRFAVICDVRGGGGCDGLDRLGYGETKGARILGACFLCSVAKICGTSFKSLINVAP